VTLSRQLEPEVMDTLEESIDYDSMDHAEVNQAFVTDLLATGPIQGDVLDLGTGTALIPIELCRRNEDVRVMAIDLSTHMLDQARINLEFETMTDRIMLDRVDAKQLIYEDSRFSVVLSNSIVHHLADPRPALTEALRVLEPGGLLFVRDLMRPNDETTLKQLIETYAGDANEHQRQMFDESLRAALDLNEMRKLVEELGCDPQQVTASSDRHWTWIHRKEISP